MSTGVTSQVRGTDFHQVVYHWSTRHLLGAAGVGPVATSLDLTRLREWDSVLGGRIFTAVDVGYAYLVHGHEAAILRKCPAQDEEGRRNTFAHVIIGSSSRLDAAAAIGLTDWQHWGTPGVTYGQKLDTLGGADLIDDAMRGVARLADSLRNDPNARGLLVELVAGVVDDPSGKFTVLRDGVPVPELLHGLLAVLGNCAETWTFATGEERATGRGLPRIVFTSTGESSPDRRKLVLRGGEGHVGVTRPSPQARELAQALVAEHQADPSGVADRPDRPIETMAHVAIWVKQMRSQLPRRALRRVLTGGQLSADDLRVLRDRTSQVNIEAELRGCDTSQLTAYLTVLAPNTVLAGQLPSITAKLHAEAVQRVLGDDPSDDALVAAVCAQVSPERVRAEVEMYLSEAGLPATPPGAGVGTGVQRDPACYTLLTKALRLGVDLGRVRVAVNKLLARVPTGDLVLGALRAAQSTPPSPDLVRILLSSVNGVADTSTERSRTRQLVENHGFLLDVLPHTGWSLDERVQKLGRLLAAAYREQLIDGSGVRWLVKSFEKAQAQRPADERPAASALLLRALCIALQDSPLLLEVHAEMAVRFCELASVPPYSPPPVLHPAPVAAVPAAAASSASSHRAAKVPVPATSAGKSPTGSASSPPPAPGGYELSPDPRAPQAPPPWAGDTKRSRRRRGSSRDRLSLVYVVGIVVVVVLAVGLVIGVGPNGSGGASQPSGTPRPTGIPQPAATSRATGLPQPAVASQPTELARPTAASPSTATSQPATTHQPSGTHHR